MRQEGAVLGERVVYDSGEGVLTQALDGELCEVLDAHDVACGGNRCAHICLVFAGLYLVDQRGCGHRGQEDGIFC